MEKNNLYELGYKPFDEVKNIAIRDKDFLCFFRDLKNDNKCLFKPYITEMNYFDKNRNRKQTKIKCIAVVEINQDFEILNSYFQVVNKIIINHEHDIEIIKEMYQKFKKETINSYVNCDERC